MQLSGWPMSYRVPSISASPPALGLSTCTTVPWFYMCTRDRDSVPHVCRAVTLLQNRWSSLEFPFPFMYGGHHHQKIRSTISLMMACRNIWFRYFGRFTSPPPFSHCYHHGLSPAFWTLIFLLYFSCLHECASLLKSLFHSFSVCYSLLMYFSLINLHPIFTNQSSNQILLSNPEISYEISGSFLTMYVV